MKAKFEKVFVNDVELANRYGIARQSVWRWVKEGRLPAPVKLSPGCSRWRLAGIEQWESEKVTAAQSGSQNAMRRRRSVHGVKGGTCEIYS